MENDGLVKCKSDFAYFAKKYLMINDGTKLKPLNDFQIEEVNEYQKNNE